jgi:hypothetical protein
MPVADPETARVRSDTTPGSFAGSPRLRRADPEATRPPDPAGDLFVGCSTLLLRSESPSLSSRRVIMNYHSASSRVCASHSRRDAQRELDDDHQPVYAEPAPAFTGVDATLGRCLPGLADRGVGTLSLSRIAFFSLPASTVAAAAPHVAQVAELVDAHDSGSCGLTLVGVRLPPWAPCEARRDRTRCDGATVRLLLVTPGATFGSCSSWPSS